MKFLANENFPVASVMSMRSAGHDVLHVAEVCPGATDVQVLDLARAQGRIVVTFDRDYGELIYKLRHPSPAGIIYLRFDPQRPTEPAQVLAPAIAAHPMGGRFTVIERDRLRQRPLPAS